MFLLMYYINKISAKFMYCLHNVAAIAITCLDKLCAMLYNIAVKLFVDFYSQEGVRVYEKFRA